MPEIDFSLPYERFILWIRNDLQTSELNTCFQKANDRSFSLIRLDTRLMEQIKSILYELETAISGTQFGDQLLKQALFTEFMVHVNRNFSAKNSTLLIRDPIPLIPMWNSLWHISTRILSRIFPLTLWQPGSFSANII